MLTLIKRWLRWVTKCDHKAEMRSLQAQLNVITLAFNYYMKLHGDEHRAELKILNDRIEQVNAAVTVVRSRMDWSRN